MIRNKFMILRGVDRIAETCCLNYRVQIQGIDKIFQKSVTQGDTIREYEHNTL